MSVWTRITGTLRADASPRHTWQTREMPERIKAAGIEHYYGPIDWSGITLQHAWTMLKAPTDNFPFDYGYGTMEMLTYNKDGVTVGCTPYVPTPCGAEGIEGQRAVVTFDASEPMCPQWFVNIDLDCRLRFTVSDNMRGRFWTYIRLWLDVLWCHTGVEGYLEVTPTEGEKAKLYPPGARYRDMLDYEQNDAVIAAYILKRWCDIQCANAFSKSKDKYNFETWYLIDCTDLYNVEDTDKYVKEHGKETFECVTGSDDN